MNRIVVVGNGIAGLTVCDSLRTAGYDGGLTVVGAERHQPYSRPALSKALLNSGAEGNDDGGLTAHELPAPSHGAAELLGIGAVGLDVEARIVRLDDGTELPYDGLVIASGSRAKHLAPVGSGESVVGHDVGRDDGTGEPRALTLRTFEDAVELRRRLKDRPSVIVVGAGALGMEVASSCLQAGCGVTLVSDAPPLSRQLGGYLSDVFTSAAARRGLHLISGTRARLLAGPVSGVVLDDGTELHAELVVSAVGDEPNTGWLAGSGLLAANGSLQVDSRGRVRADIVAAGDVATIPTRHGMGRVPLWTSAIEQAKVAALGLLQGDAAPVLDFQPYFWTEAFGISLKSVGFTPVHGVPEYREPGSGEESMLLRWGREGGSGTAAALNYRIPVPKLRRLADTGPAVRMAV